jgi:hypothetical protein
MQEAGRMAKTLIIVAVLFGFAWAYPPTRARMVVAAQPALERMGPVGERLITPVKRYNTRTELKFIVEQIKLTRTEGRELPDERTFQRWISRRLLTKNQGKDPWGFQYYMITVSGTVTVGSVGEDGQRGTDDDIRESTNF